MPTQPYLVFNGDADGICAAHLFKLANPANYEFVTGVKRDISLLRKIDTIEDSKVMVFDVAVEKNLDELKRLLSNGCEVIWFDHHVSEVIPIHVNLSTRINTSAEVNTSYLVADYLEKPSLWTVVGLFGDNMAKPAEKMAHDFSITTEDTAKLKQLSELMNYNGYGGSLDDLTYHPADILDMMADFADPLDFISNSDLAPGLRSALKTDLECANTSDEIAGGVFLFPDEKWARRVVGTYANMKSVAEPDKAHAILVKISKESGYVVSVRSPENSDISAAELCKQFETGGGRKKSAGINYLNDHLLHNFIEKFEKHYLK